MLRQGAQRLLLGGAAFNKSASDSGKLLWNAALFSSRAAGAEAQAATPGVQAPIAQYSAAAAAALASKSTLKIPTGLGSLSLSSSNAYRLFSASGKASAAPAAAVAEKAAEASSAKPSSLFSTLAKAAAVLAGAVALATSTASADTPNAWQFLFQDSATSTAQAMFDLHHDIAFFLITIISIVLYMLFQFTTKFHYSRVVLPEKVTHHTALELIWTVIPTMIILSVGIPSLTLIYSLDSHQDKPGLTVKIIGRQWYWSYEMNDHLQHKLVNPDKLVAIAEKSILKA